MLENGFAAVKTMRYSPRSYILFPCAFARRQLDLPIKRNFFERTIMNLKNAQSHFFNNRNTEAGNQLVKNDTIVKINFFLCGKKLSCSC